MTKAVLHVDRPISPRTHRMLTLRCSCNGLVFRATKQPKRSFRYYLGFPRQRCGDRSIQSIMNAAGHNVWCVDGILNGTALDPLKNRHNDRPIDNTALLMRGAAFNTLHTCCVEVYPSLAPSATGATRPVRGFRVRWETSVETAVVDGRTGDSLATTKVVIPGPSLASPWGGRELRCIGRFGVLTLFWRASTR